MHRVSDMSSVVPPSILNGWQYTKFGGFFGRFPALLTLLCLNALVQGMLVNGFVSTSIVSLERRFQLSSSQSAVVATAYDVSVALCLFPLSIWAHKVNKIRIIAWGMLILSFGSFLMVAPHFHGKYSVNQAGAIIEPVCTLTKTSEECAGLNEFQATLNYIVLIVAQLLIGVGAGPLFTYGLSVIDEKDGQHKTSRNLAIYMGVSTIGPALAFLLSSFYLKIWGDIGRTNYADLGITGPDDPRWYGAWWIGFAMSGALSLVTGAFLFVVPRHLSGNLFATIQRMLSDTEERKKNDVVMTHRDLMKDYSHEATEFTRYRKTLVLILTSRVCVALIGMQVVESLLMNGYITFVPKLFENLFGMSSSMSSMVTGAIVVPMGIIGNYLGGWVGGKYRGFKKSVAVCIGFNVFSLVACTSLLITCPQREIAGITASYPNSQTTGVPLHVTSSPVCSSACHCDGLFEPVCEKSTSLSYVSPCHAGCLSRFNTSSWTQCGCTQEPLQTGFCSVDCSWKPYAFFSIFALMAGFIFATGPLIQSCTLRVVSHEHRDIYICAGWFFMRFMGSFRTKKKFLGSIPGAILFGYVFDGTCALWLNDECTKRDVCRLYKPLDLSFNMFLLSVILKFLTIVCLSVAYISYKPLSVEEDENAEATSDTKCPDSALSLATLSRNGTTAHADVL